MEGGNPQMGQNQPPSFSESASVEELGGVDINSLSPMDKRMEERFVDARGTDPAQS